MHGRTLSIIVKPSWNMVLHAGNVEPAVQYVVDAGGASVQEDYQYAGQNMFCRQAKHAQKAEGGGARQT